MIIVPFFLCYCYSIIIEPLNISIDTVNIADLRVLIFPPNIEIRKPQLGPNNSSIVCSSDKILTRESVAYAQFYFYTSYLCYVMISVAYGIRIPPTKADGFANYMSKVRMCACQRSFVRL